MPQFRYSEAARLLAVSDDTVRRWVDDGRFTSIRDSVGRKVIDGAELAEFTRTRARSGPSHLRGAGDASGIARSARNQFVGLVTDVTTDKVMAQVEMQCGPHRVVSLMSAEAVQELGLEPGVLAVAVVKSTSVVVEVTSALSGPEDASV
ncbi:MAG TPA: TOBE domain-containing protein [Pseudonocardiaceae bacterium]|nr:TOBE domain-containing protein [Pseudonocardiaceae bacterium]